MTEFKPSLKNKTSIWTSATCDDEVFFPVLKSSLSHDLSQSLVTAAPRGRWRNCSSKVFISGWTGLRVWSQLLPVQPVQTVSSGTRTQLEVWTHCTTPQRHPGKWEVDRKESSADKGHSVRRQNRRRTSEHSSNNSDSTCHDQKRSVTTHLVLKEPPAWIRTEPLKQSAVLLTALNHLLLIETCDHLLLLL